MMYQDDNFNYSQENIALMAKEYAEKLAKKEIEQFEKPISELFKNLVILKNLYNNLNKYAKTNALTFTRELLKVTDYQIDKIKENFSFVNEDGCVKTVNDNYLQIFKQCLSYEINSLKSCFYCENIEKTTKKCDIFKQIEEITSKKITILINCL